AVAGSRHSMGGQCFATDDWLVDMRGCDALQRFDCERGLVTIGSGACWPAVIAACRAADAPGATSWSIRQKQTGADDLSLGGSLAANVHGRGARMPPLVADVESFELVDARGELVHCDRASDPRLFAHVIGGYGMFGVVTAVTLRLMPRLLLERNVGVCDADAALAAIAAIDTSAWIYGDFQFEIDPRARGFLRRGVWSTYRRTDQDRAVPQRQVELARDEWRRLLELAHTDPTRAFASYAAHYLRTDGQLYWSDTHQLSTYLDGYHADLDAALGDAHRGSEMITELYVRRERLLEFLDAAARVLRARDARVIYGTIRFVERDAETALAWAREPWACVIFNLHVQSGDAGRARSRDDFRALIDVAADLGGSYYLTYHRWASRAQLVRCHPSIEAVLREKQRCDPLGVLTSDWYRHTRALVDGTVPA
ncbi:MAG: FAD-binding oxidoreductase, partial [Planctomycetota bacterium]